MGAGNRIFAYAFAAVSQAAALIYLGYIAGPWLDLHYPQDFRWKPVSLTLSLISVAHVFYLFFKVMLKCSLREKEKET